MSDLEENSEENDSNEENPEEWDGDFFYSDPIGFNG